MLLSFPKIFLVIISAIWLANPSQGAKPNKGASPSDGHDHGFECGVKDADPDTPDALSLLISKMAAGKVGAGGRRLVAPDRSFEATVPTIYHIIEIDETEGQVTDEIIQDQHDVLNEAYAGTGFTFDLIGTTRTNNAAWFVPFPDSREEIAMKAALHQGGWDVLNVYVVGLPLFYGGYASLPTVVLLDGVEQDGVVINKDFLPGGAAEDNDLGKVLAHEVGHWFDLYHTFQGGCDSAYGDFVDDTPAEILTGFHRCEEGAPPEDSCPDQPGLDPVTNFMSYSVDQCYSGFTEKQIARMQTTWKYFRPGFGATSQCMKLCWLMIPDTYSSLGECLTARCKESVVEDTCDKAKPIPLGKAVSGSTIFAEPDAAPTCGTIESLAPGVWYSVKGNGGLLRASTCSFTDILFDSRISVYKDGCDTLTCVAANEDGETCTDGRSEVEFLSEKNVDYLILVHGFSLVLPQFGIEFYSSGTFDLIVDKVQSGSCFEATYRPACEDLTGCASVVCALDPFCCDVGWIWTCVQKACELCSVPDPLPILCEECSSATTSDMEISILTDAWPGEITWEVKNLSKGGVKVAQGGPYQTEFIEFVETVPGLCTDDCFEFTIFDSFGDGICCFSGDGGYTITFDGIQIVSPSGGAYGSTESVQIGNCSE